MLLQHLLDLYTADPWWIGGSAALFLIVLGLFLFSLVRNLRRLLWFYGASVLAGGVFAFFVFWYPLLLESLASFRSDWSLVFLVQSLSFSALIKLLVFHIILYSFMGIILLVTLAWFALMTFRWQRFKTLLERAFSESWSILLFAFATALFNYLALGLFAQFNFVTLSYLFTLFAFLFTLQLFLHLVDNAYLRSSKHFIEYVYATGLMFFLFRFAADGLISAGQEVFVASGFFFTQLFAFFLAVLLLGFVATFFVRAIFPSRFFLEQYEQHSPELLVKISRVLFSQRKTAYAAQRVLIGLVLAMLVGFLFLVALLLELYLVLIPAFFLAYLALFYLLDRQDDMRVKGELVEQRIENAGV